MGPLLQPRLQEDVRPKDKCRNYQMCYLSSRKECFIRYACVLLGMLTQRRFKMLQERFYRYPRRISMGLSVGLELVFHFFLMLIFAVVMWELCADGNYSVSMTGYRGLVI